MRNKSVVPNIVGITAVIAFLLMLIMLPAAIATAGGTAKVIVSAPKTRAVFTGHSFATGEGVRTYLFDLHIDPSSKELAATPYTVKTRISWNGANHTLTVHNEDDDKLWGHQQIDVKYQCDKDPILDPSAKCRYVSHTPYQKTKTLYPEGHSNNVIYFNPLDFYDPTQEGSVHLSVYRGVISAAKLRQLILEAMAKSMTPIKPEPGKKVPADVFLKVKVASDIPIPPKQAIDFYVARQDRKPLLDASGKKIAMPITAKFITSNEAFKIIKKLPQGLYLFHARMMTSLTTGMDSKTVSFLVGKKAIPHFKPGLVISSPLENKYYNEDIPVTIKLPQLKPGSSLRLILGFQEDTVPNGNNPLQAHPFPISVMNEKFNLKTGQKTFTKKYRHNQLITATKNKPGQFTLRVEVSLPGAGIKSATRIFHLAQLGNAVSNVQQKKSGKIKLNLPASHGLTGSGVSTKSLQSKPNSPAHSSLTNKSHITKARFKPTVAPNSSKSIRSDTGKTYHQESLTLGKAPSVALSTGQKSFKAPASVKIRVGLGRNTEVEYQIQYNDCKSGKKYRTVSLKPKIAIKDKNTKILTFPIRKAGCYRVRARHRKTGAGAVWSKWCEFTVTDRKISTIKMTPSLKPHSTQIQTKAINPQPEPPGRPTLQPGINSINNHPK